MTGQVPFHQNERPTCARDSDWCDGVICRERGIECPNADPPACPQCGEPDCMEDTHDG